MSWQATSYSKSLKVTPSGLLISRSEKLVCLILADYHNTEHKGAWPSARTLSRDCLLTIRHVRRILASLRQKQVLCISKRKRNGGGFDSNMYHFHQIDCSKDHTGGSDIMSPPGDADLVFGSQKESWGEDTAMSSPVVTSTSSKLLTEESGKSTLEDSHTHMGEDANSHTRVCDHKSRFTLEQLRNYAWLSYNCDRKLESSRGIKVKGIENPEGWATRAYETGKWDSQVEEFLRNPGMFG
jgi:hypothetical protein